MPNSTQQTTGSLSTRIAACTAPDVLTDIPQWNVMRHLGSGSTAEVWLLFNGLTRDYVVAKTPRADSAAPALRREAELAGQVHHEHLLSTVDTGLFPELQAVSASRATFWPYLAGGSLATLLSAVDKLSVAQAMTVMLPMVGVVHWLHTRQIVHGDVSPHNVLFDLNGRPMLIDLGATRASAHSFECTGTPGFTAPEVMAPGTMQGLGAAADVYSLAALAWFCLTGLVPAAPIHRIPLPTLLPDVPRDIVMTLEAGLAEDPEDRPTTASLLKLIGEWGIPEPLDLHAAVKEEHLLVLPTRKPAESSGQHRGPNRRTQKRLKTPTAQKMGKLVRRTVIVLGCLGLATGALVTTFGAQPDNAHEMPPPFPAEVTTTAPAVDVDVQGIIDELARDRSLTWAMLAPEKVREYAVADSPAFLEDYRVLSALSQASHVLDGIRMRGFVETMELDENRLQVSVRWTTSAYEQRDAHGQVVGRVAETTQPVVLDLTRVEGQWLLREVTSNSA